MKKHATRNELSQAFIDIWLTLNFRVCCNTPNARNPITPNVRATRAQLQREIIDMKLQITALLHKYQELMDDEVVLNNRRCVKNNRRHT